MEGPMLLGLRENTKPLLSGFTDSVIMVPGNIFISATVPRVVRHSIIRFIQNFMCSLDIWFHSIAFAFMAHVLVSI